MKSVILNERYRSSVRRHGALAGLPKLAEAYGELASEARAETGTTLPN